MQKNVRLPSKTQYISQTNAFVPSNLYKQANNTATSFMTTAGGTFNQDMNLNETQRRTETIKKSSLGNTIKPSQAKSLKNKPKQKNKRKPAAKTIGEADIEFKRSLLSGSSVSGLSSPPSRTNFKRPFEEEEEPVKRSQPKRSVSEQKQSLPGNHTAPEILYKGVFQNNYMMADTIEVKDSTYSEIPVRKDYRYFEEQYNQEKKQTTENIDFQSSHTYLENKLRLYGLTGTENIEPNPQQSRKFVSISDNINNSHNHFNYSFVPDSFNFEKIPGYVANRKTRSEKEKSIIKIQSLVRGMIARKRIAHMKDTLTRHFNGDLLVSPYEIEFFDLNIPVFQQILGIKGENKTATKGSSAVKENIDDDPKKKLLSNTFYSVLRSGFFPEDPMDYVVLAELQDYEDATFPKLLKEQAEANSKEVMLAKKYEYLFGKPSVDRELRSDDKSVIKNFLKTNLTSITAADLKVGKFQTDYKSIIKPKVKVEQPTYVSPSPFKNNYTSSAVKASSPVADTNKFKKFDSYAAKNLEKSIQSEISEDYSNDFEEDSAIKESISQSGIRESIRYSMDESRIRESIRDSIRESIIKESIDYNSPPKKLKHRFSNKSISEDIVESYGGMGKNSSVKSIQEDIPLSESIVASRVHQNKRKPSVDDDIEEDIDIKDSYGNEEFESLEESIQESIDKFQAMRKSPSPDKKEKKPSSPKRSPEEKFSTAKPMFKKSASKDEEVSPIIPKPQSFLAQKTTTTKPVAEPLMATSEKKNLYKFSEVIPEEPAGYEEYRREERKKYMIDENLLNLPKSNTAEILFTNFQKELEKMLYMDSLTQKVGALENTIDKLYNQKEFNLLNTLQNRASSSAGFQPTQSINPVQGVSDSDSNNFMVYLMQKNNALERSMAALSKQMNFLVNNFTGAQTKTAAGVPGVPAAKAERKPRPIIPVRKSQSLRPKTADVKKESTSPAPRIQPAAMVQKETKKQESPKREVTVVQSKTQPQVVVQPKTQPQVVVQQPIQVKEQQAAVQPQPIKKVEPEKKPKFAFKFAPEAKSAVKDEEEEITLNLPSTKKEPEPIVVVKSPTPAVVQPPVSTYKSAKFGKWQQESSSEGAVEEEIIENLSEKSLPQKKEKSSEEEVDFSVKDYSESFEKLSPLTTPKKAIISKFEDKKLLTPKQDEASKYSESFEELTPASTTRKPSPQKKQPSPKHKSEEDIDELIIDEDIDLPSDTKEEPPVITKPVFKKAEPEALILPFTQTTTAPVKKPEPEPAFEEIEDDEEYGEEDFEELSLPSENGDETPVKVTPKADNKPFVKEEERSWSEDLEASQDMSVISWQGNVWTAHEAARNELKALEEKEKKMKEEKKKIEDEQKKAEAERKKLEDLNKSPEEKKADNVADAVVDSIMEHIGKELFPKRNPAQIEDVKSKIKHANVSEQHLFDVHQDVVDQVMASPKQEEKIEKAEEEEHHLKHYKKVEEDVKVIIAKMNQAPKHQLIHIVMNHINFSDPNDPKSKLSIFDKSPVKDESIIDAYNEIFLNLFRSEFRKLNTDFATTPRVQAKMEIKMAGLIARSQEILLKRIRKTTTTPEFYNTMGKNFNNIYDTLRNKKLEGEENDFYEEEEDIKRLIEEENNKLKETIADQVMESLFEETVKDLIRISQNRKKL